MNDEQKEILRSLDTLDNSIDNLITAGDIQIIKRIQNSVDKLKPKVAKFKAAGLDVSSFERTLDELDKKTREFLREFN